MIHESNISCPEDEFYCNWDEYAAAIPIGVPNE